MHDIAKMLGELAQHALHEELTTYPKAGLVSHIDNGSHPDMDYALFLTSIQRLGNYFKNVAYISMRDHTFAELESLGLHAEQEMLLATKNINTHRGAIFVLGLIVAATAYCYKNNLPYHQINITIATLYGKGLSAHTVNQYSHGSIIRKQFQLESIIDAAIKGFPLIFTAVEKLNHFKMRHDYREAKLRTFFFIMEYLDDTNLVYRGGIEGLQFVKDEANKILKIENPKMFNEQARNLHQVFISKNLSPGGCADLLATVIFLDEAQKLWV